MKLYRQSILLFGLILPLLLVAVIAGAGLYAKSSFEATLGERQAQLKSSKDTAMAIAVLDKKNAVQKPHLERWTKLLAQETASTVTTNLREIIGNLPDKEIQLTSFDPATKAGFGTASAQKSSSVRIALRGTYRTVQKAFLELETRMPQLQLEDLKIDPNAQSALLNFQVTYTAWES